MGFPEELKTAGQEDVQPVKLLPYEELYRAFLDLGILLQNQGSWVDFYRLAKRGPVHPSYAVFFKAMPEPALKALSLAILDGRLTQLTLFKAFTTGSPPPDVLIPVR